MARLTLSILMLLAMTASSYASEKISYQRKLDDQRIEKDFTLGLRWVDKQLDAEETFIRCYNGYVLLYGSVKNNDLGEKATAHAERLAGVRRVFNQLQVGGKKPDFLEQVILDGKIRSNLITATSFDGSKVRFESYFTTVYLMGLVTPEEAEDIVDLVSSIKGVEEIVTAFEYLE